MGRIAVLDQSVAELIAAGEVIERPASIVKEVLENSIDAGATHIVVEIKNGGRTYIRVTDNGCGIAKEDMPVAFLRHATSKIHGDADLQNISTLGFRGEALASICAVAEVEMTSKVKEEDFGNQLRMKAAEQISFEPTGCPDGTTIIIRNLFYNVPARLKFLKKDGSETAAVSSVVEKLMLSHPEVSFRYITDGTVKLSGGGDGNLESSIYAVFGREFAFSMMPVDYAFGGIRVTGCITRPDAGRATRGMQHFYVNNRFVKSKTCATALEDGYRGSIMVGKFPGCVLNIDMEYSMVDVNVHPAKIEIRFSDEKAVYEAVYFAVKNTLLANEALQNQMNQPVSLAPAVKPVTGTQVAFSQNAPVLKETESKYRNLFGKDDSPKEEIPPEYQSEDVPPPPDTVPADMIPPDMIPSDQELSPEPELQNPYRRADAPEIDWTEYYFTHDFSTVPADYVKQGGKLSDDFEGLADFEESAELAEEQGNSLPEEMQDGEEESLFTIPTADLSAEMQFRLVGEVFATYVVLESETHLILLDKHAAHERILYEQLKKQTQLGESQLLLEPVSVVVSREESDQLFSSREQLEKFGFSFDDFGNNTVLIRAVPPILSACEPYPLLLEAAQKISANRKDPIPEWMDQLLHEMACKAAIKAHDISTEAELIHLAKQVLQNDELRHCPHGRPVLQLISKTELDRRFGRIV